VPGGGLHDIRHDMPMVHRSTPFRETRMRITVPVVLLLLGASRTHGQAPTAASALVGRLVGAAV
jgi:hypothetical protein